MALPGQPFDTTPIPVSLWFLNRDKANGFTQTGAPPWRDRRGEFLFIDCRKLGSLIDRTHRELTDDNIARVSATYHAWRGEPDAGSYEDEPGFCASATVAQVAEHRFMLTPGRYVGAVAVEDDELIGQKVARLTRELYAAYAESNRLQVNIRRALGRLDCPDHRDSHPLGELADITVGHVGPMASEYVPEGIPFLRSQDVKPFRLDLSAVKYISDAFNERLKKSALVPGDVVVVRTGNARRGRSGP